MIDWLRSAKSANFYKKRRRLPKAAITELFRTIRQNSDTPSQNAFHHVKEALGHASWSAIAFFYERSPSFLELPEGHARERVCGFLMSWSIANISSFSSRASICDQHSKPTTSGARAMTGWRRRSHALTRHLSRYVSETWPLPNMLSGPRHSKRMIYGLSLAHQEPADMCLAAIAFAGEVTTTPLHPIRGEFRCVRIG